MFLYRENLFTVSLPDDFGYNFFGEKEKPWQIAYGFHALATQTQMNVIQNNFYILSIKLQLNWFKCVKDDSSKHA